MGIFKIKNIEDDSIVEVISMNIDIENNILVLQNGKLDILGINNFKDMILGTNPNPKNLGEIIKEPTHKIDL